MAEERRHGIGEFAEELADVRIDMAVVKADIESQSGTRKIMWGVSATVIIQLIAFSVGYGEIKTKLDSMDLSNLQADLSTALTVLGDHGTELKNVRDEQFRLRGMSDDMRKQFQQELNSRTADRFFKSDWELSKLWLDERFNNIELRLERVEKKAHKQ
jgi:hypothetical protein